MDTIRECAKVTGEDELVIRQCLPKDIEPLRRLAVDTAYFGRSCEFFFPDRELLADLIMEYYVRYEPEHTWVAEYNREVIGYLSAGFDQKKYTKYFCGKILPRAIRGALWRGKIWDQRTWRLIWCNLQASLRRENNLLTVDKKRYPVHIHQNVRDGFRGKKIGSRLVVEFLKVVDRERLGVCFRALRPVDDFAFFQRYGFRRHDFRRVKTWERWLDKTPLYFMEYVRDAV